MNRYGYGSYRGRSPWKKALKIILIVILILIGLAAAATIYLQQFLVISNDGVYLDIPFLTADTSPAPSVQPSVPVVLVTPSPQPTPEPEKDPSSPVVLPLTALSDGSAAEQVKNAGGDCALFDMKADESTLGYVSSIPMIANTPLNGQDASLNEAILAMNETEDLYTVARVSCFKDAYVFLYNDAFPIRTNSGYCWTGPDTLMWISPTSSDVQDYITQICIELAQLGFDEILLDNAGYPSEGNLDYIRRGSAYDPSRFSAVVGSFYADLSSALSEYEVKLSIVTTESAMSGGDSLSGQTPENLSVAHRLWITDASGTLCPVRK